MNDTYLADLEWEQFDPKRENYMDIGSHFIPKNSLFLDRFTVWDELFPVSGANTIYSKIGSLIFFMMTVYKIL